MPYKISVCIPVYNCAEYLFLALNSILPQADDQIEVIVYDGGSTDTTSELMNEYIKAWPKIQYHRGSQRGGIDADLAKCIDFAKGEFCWLFSGDDIMRPGAIQKALEWIHQGYDIYICKHTFCNKKMEIFYEYPVMKPDKIFFIDLALDNERHEWFSRAITTEAFFSFMSSIIVRKKTWLKGELPFAFEKSCWGHVARFFELIPMGLRVCYIAEVMLDKRGENDSFADHGIVNRIRIGVDGFHGLADHYFGHESMEAYHIRRTIRNELSLSTLLSIKLRCTDQPQLGNIELLDKLVSRIYCDHRWDVILKRFIYFSIPYWALIVLKFCYQPLKLIRPELKYG